jgi:hypothetical protein
MRRKPVSENLNLEMDQVEIELCLRKEVWKLAMAKASQELH